MFYKYRKKTPTFKTLKRVHLRTQFYHRRPLAGTTWKPQSSSPFVILFTLLKLLLKINQWFASTWIQILMIMIALKGLWVTMLYIHDAGLNVLSQCHCTLCWGEIMSYYTSTMTSTKIWTNLHRLVLWTAQCCSSPPPRLKDSQCRGKKNELKHFY